MSVLDDDKPNVWIHPPFLMLGVFIAAFGLRAVYGGFMPLPRLVAEGIGTLMIIGAIVILQLGISTFADGGEQLRPSTPSRQLFTKGVYGLSRNPIYLAMMLLGAGLGFATLNSWTVGLTLLAGVLLNFLVIKPEERYLEDRFGDEYETYKKSVRRWI